NEEAGRRKIFWNAVAKELGFTPGYLIQLNNGIRKVEQISPKFTLACARFLGVPPITVKLAAGSISIDDFRVPTESIEDSINRAFRKMQDDPKIKFNSPSRLNALPLDAKQAVLELYMQTTSIDPFEVQDLPVMLKNIKTRIDIQQATRTLFDCITVTLADVRNNTELNERQKKALKLNEYEGH
ncbi:MAG: hypothetical protein ABI606_16345, partial [Rhodoferax sp.]